MPDQAKYEGHVEVKVRTPAGISHEFRLAEDEFVASAMAQAVAHFVEHSQLAPGDYALAVVRDGRVEPLLDTARVGDYHLTAGAELHLVNEAPQVDG
ncbi:MAG: hypothetical protein ACLQK4_13020 [Acidimicrobiales bacterium]|jgi:uncharacterized protein (DUF2141 family)